MGLFDKLKQRAQSLRFRALIKLHDHPALCVVCTSLPATEFKADAGSASNLTTDWLRKNRDVLVGTVLGIDKLQDVQALVAKWEDAGFTTTVMSDVAPENLPHADHLVKHAEAFLKAAGGAPADYVSFVLGSPDVFKKTSVLIYCWFFKLHSR